MVTIVVWVLVLWSGGKPVVIDNIDSRANCVALAQGVNADLGFGQSSWSCRAVRKVAVR